MPGRPCLATEGAAQIRYIDDFVSAGSGGLSNPRNIAFGQDGYLYAASQFSNQVLRYDSHTGAFVDAVITGGSSGVVLDNPWALSFGPDSKLYVAGRNSNNVLRYDPATGTVNEFIPSGNGVWNPKGLTFGPDGNLYVSNADASTTDTSILQDQVVRFQGPAGPTPGQFIDVFIARGDHGLDNPNGLVFSGNNLYVANTRGESISRYDATTGVFQDVFVPQNSGGLRIPSSIALRSGYLYVTSQGTAQVLRYQANTGAFVDAIVTAGSPDVDSTAGFDFDLYGNLYVGFRDGISGTPSLNDTYQVLRYGPASQAAFTVTLSAASTTEVTVDYKTADGTATAGLDYVHQALHTLKFAPGVTKRTVLVPTLNDRLGEPNETFALNLSNALGATIADGQGVATIVDDEPRISISDVTKAEGKRGQTTLFTFTVTLSAAYDQAVTMSYRTVNGTATTSDGDYIAKTGTLTFAPGETTKTITIEVKGDSRREADEYFYLDLYGLSINGLFTKNRGIGTILNDD